MNRSKAKGTAAETAVVRWARLNGFPGADRQPLRGNRDAGDINLAPGLVLEVKNHAGVAGAGQPAPAQLAEWMAQADLECANAGAAHCPLVVKRTGVADPGRWFVYVRAGDVATLLGATADLPEPLSPWQTDLRSLTRLLRWAGYGDPLPGEAVA